MATGSISRAFELGQAPDMKCVPRQAFAWFA
jgi:hypothetical protein